MDRQGVLSSHCPNIKSIQITQGDFNREKPIPEQNN